MDIITGKIKTAQKVVIYGPEGVGKSTFASQFPQPIFIDTEGSTKNLDVARFKNSSSWAMILEQIKYVKEHPDICKTLIIDTADWAEQYCVEAILAKYDKKGIEDFGYGNGYVYVREEFGRFLNLLSDLIQLDINVVVTAHAQMRKFEQPDEMGSYDRYELKLGKKTSSQTSPLVKEWADLILFANYKTYSVAVDDKGKKFKAQGGSRVMYTTHHPCWDAKNRFGLPDELPFDYNQIAHIFNHSTPVEAKAEPQKVEIEQPTQVQPTAETTQAVETPVELSENDNAKKDLTDKGIPPQLADLMVANNVSENDIQIVVSQKGYFPLTTPIRNYPTDFINGVLISAWEQVYGMIRELETLPY